METREIPRHIGVLERRVAYLQERVRSGRLSASAKAFEHREREAIEAGIAALAAQARYQDPATDPLTALEQILDARGDRELGEALDHARAVLAAHGGSE